jgi:hypothetical protein
VRRASRPSFRLRAAATVTEDRGPVTFWIDDRTFEIPSSDRDALLRRAKQLPHGLLGDLCGRIEHAGGSRPVEIHRVEELDALSDFLRDWTRKEKVSKGIRTLNREVKTQLERLLGPE